MPEHFHVTEIGQITKNFIDCGGIIRQENVVNFQLWTSNDMDHRLYPQKLLNIIALSEEALGIEDLEVEVEYQSDTIGKYSLGFNGTNFILETKKTACLASDNCGITADNNITESAGKNCCTPGTGCC
ncbi:MAG: DUF6428 family protein [Cytophaga sp.]|uniref:DUF6428 family protein n=1 Tax=Cytophaga sp. TaxID=29535 RepID=UPI003F7F8342